MYEVIHEDLGKDQDEWLRKRRTMGIGASEAARVLGISGSALELYALKTGAVDPPQDNEYMRMGRRLESPVLDEFALQTGRTVTPNKATLQSTKWPFMFCTPDAWQTSPAFRHGERGTVQAKATKRFGDWDDGVPPRVWVQMQHEFAVTGEKYGSAVVLLGTHISHEDIERDDTYIHGTLVPALEEFWTCVQEHAPFDIKPDARLETRKALAAIYPQDARGTIEVGGEFLNLHQERLDALQIQKDAKGELNHIENRFRAAMGDNTYCLLPNGAKYSLKKQERPAHHVKATSFRVLRLARKGD